MRHTAGSPLLSNLNSELAFCLAVEKLMGLEIPDRASHIRVILCELNRIASHMLFYYLTIVRQMYIETGAESTPIRVPRVTLGLLGILLAGMVFVGVYPAPAMDAIQHASDVILASDGVLQMVQH